MGAASVAQVWRVVRRSWWIELPPGRTRRPPWSVVGRGLGIGVLLGALLGGGLQASDVNYRSWITVGFAASIGAAVALPPALASAIIYQLLETRSLRLAWLACSATAAAVIVILAAALDVLTAPVTPVAALLVFTVVLATSRFITTQATSPGRHDNPSQRG